MLPISPPISGTRAGNTAQNVGESDRQCGWDLTFSAPKSVSVYWALAPDDVRTEIEEAQRAAVAAAVNFLEQECAFTRRGEVGRVGNQQALEGHLQALLELEKRRS